MAILISDFRMAFHQLEVFKYLPVENSPAKYLRLPSTYEAVFKQYQADYRQVQKELSREQTALRDAKRKGKPNDSEYATLRQRYETARAAYKQFLERDDDFMTMPLQGDNFYQYYLGGTRITRADPGVVVAALTPVCAGSLFSIPFPQGRIVCIGFAYPHANAVQVQVTFRLEPPQELSAVIDLAISLRNDFLWTTAAGETLIGILKLCQHGLDVLRVMTRGIDENPGSLKPAFSTAVFVNGSYELGESAVEEGNPLHKAMVALCTWEKRWKRFKPVGLEQHRLTPVSNEEYYEHLLYADTHSRVIWMPEYWDEESGNRLSCYYHNLVLLSMQVDSLLQLVELAFPATQPNADPLEYGMELFTRHAVDKLDELSAVDYKTYRSVSAKKQIESDPNSKAHIDRVREVFG